MGKATPPILATSRYEILAVGAFQVDVRYRPDALRLSPELRATIAGRCDSLRAQGKRVENLPLYRLLDWGVEGDRLILDCAWTCYEEHLGLRQEPGRMTDVLTITGATTCRGRLIMERRSQIVAEGSGMVHVKPSGHLHPHQSPLEGLLQEAEEELDLQESECRQAICLGWVRSLTANCHSLIYHIPVDLSADELLRRQPRDAWEHEELFTVATDAASLADWLVETYPAGITGPGHATALLYGRHCHGPAWFADVCARFLAKD